MSGIRHFIGLETFEPATLRHMIERAAELKRAPETGAGALAGKTLAMIFEMPSTRTRISFDVAMNKLGGRCIALSPGELQLGRGETIGDTARVLSRYVDAVLLRTTRHESLLQLVENADVPIINGLTDRTHPCQLMADVLTFEEHLGPIAGRRVAWLGDGNNMAATWIQAAAQFQFSLRLACPGDYAPDAEILDWALKRGADVQVTEDVHPAVAGADCVVTDTWISMGDDAGKQKIDVLRPYQVNETVMAEAAKDAIFLHCLPAKRGLEVSKAVIDGAHSLVFDEAENRLHAQQAILLWCLAGDS
ncbi:MAG: ornithine carbamoyltransferase [Alphaproteobacteria bacterium]